MAACTAILQQQGTMYTRAQSSRWLQIAALGFWNNLPSMACHACNVALPRRHLRKECDETGAVKHIPILQRSLTGGATPGCPAHGMISLQEVWGAAAARLNVICSIIKYASSIKCPRRPESRLRPPRQSDKKLLSPAGKSMVVLLFHMRHPDTEIISLCYARQGACQYIQQHASTFSDSNSSATTLSCPYHWLRLKPCVKHGVCGVPAA